MVHSALERSDRIVYVSLFDPWFFSVAVRSTRPQERIVPFAFDTTYTQLPSRCYTRVHPTPVAAPGPIAFNRDLAADLHLTIEELSSPEGIAALSGNRIPKGADPIALAYAGHQFGGFVPQLGDGRAILLGEIVGRQGRRDIQLKGSGPTAYSRGGDGRAAIGPVIREYLVSEAMFALGIPTTRALAAVTTGELVYRDEALPGAILTRVAQSHMRIGTFQYFAARNDREALERLVEYALQRHYPHVSREDGAALTLIESVMRAQSRLVAQWLGVGFVHGVMNTDNMSISGETIDYGPCAFLDIYDPRRTFSSIDHGGRYAFANQPRIALWNLARLGEALVTLVDEDEERAAATLTERLQVFPDLFQAEYAAVLRRKLGLSTAQEGDMPLAQKLLEILAANKVDYTSFFRALSKAPLTSDASDLRRRFANPSAFDEWFGTWKKRLGDESSTPMEQNSRMSHANPAIIPRNHRVEEGIRDARAGNFSTFERLHKALASPYEEVPEYRDLTEPPGAEQWNYRTFCGT